MIAASPATSYTVPMKRLIVAAALAATVAVAVAQDNETPQGTPEQCEHLWSLYWRSVSRLTELEHCELGFIQCSLIKAQYVSIRDRASRLYKAAGCERYEMHGRVLSGSGEIFAEEP